MVLSPSKRYLDDYWRDKMGNSKWNFLQVLVKSIEQIGRIYQRGIKRSRSKTLSSRNILALALILIGLFWVSAGWAQDELGVFFDTAGTSNSITTSSDNEIVVAYLIIVNPSASSGIEAYSGTVIWLPTLGDWGFSSTCAESWAPMPTLLLICPEPLPWAVRRQLH